jgi:hypothetical protein
MVFEALRGHPVWFYTDDDRRSIRSAFTIPTRTAVWIAKCVDLPGIYCSSTDHSESARQTPDETRMYVTTLAFGTIALQVATAKVPPSIPAAVPITTDVRPGPWDKATLSLWPISTESLAWPPEIGLAGELGIETLHSRWGEGHSSDAAV